MNINTNNIDDFGWKSEEPAAFQSLRSALMAYFGTYHSTLQVRPITPLTTVSRLEPSITIRKSGALILTNLQELCAPLRPKTPTVTR